MIAGLIENKLTKGLLAGAAALGVGILALPQEANAGAADALAQAQFNLVFDIDGDGVPDDVSAIFNGGTTIRGNALADVDGMTDSDDFGPLACPNGDGASASVDTSFGSAQALSFAECNGGLEMGNQARAGSQPPIPGVLTSSFADALTSFEGTIIPAADLTLNLDGEFVWGTQVVIEGWNEGETKTAEATIIAGISLINDTTGDTETLFDFATSLGLSNENGELGEGDTELIALNVPLIANNQYRLSIESEEVAVTEAQEIPEPASVFGLLAVGGLGLGLKRQKKQG